MIKLSMDFLFIFPCAAFFAANIQYGMLCNM